MTADVRTLELLGAQVVPALEAARLHAELTEALAPTATQARQQASATFTLRLRRAGSLAYKGLTSN